MACNANREKKPEMVTMVAAWGDVREVIPEMVAVLEEQGWKRKLDGVTAPKQEQGNG
jgi:hypothetical protein